MCIRFKLFDFIILCELIRLRTNQFSKAHYIFVEFNKNKINTNNARLRER